MKESQSGGKEPNVPQTPAESTPPPAMPGVSEFVTRLVLQNRYLFTTEQLQTVDELAGLLRQARQESARAQDDEQRLKADRKRAKAEAMLVELLQRLSGVIPVDLRNGGIKIDYTHPHKLATNSTAVILHIDAGERVTHFVLKEWDIETHPEPAPPMELEVAAQGSTWALIDFKNAPPGKTLMYIKFKAIGSGKEITAGAMTVEAPEMGTLSVKVLDEKGDPTPALIRLTSKLTNSLQCPAGAIDFWPQMGAISGVAGDGPGKPQLMRVAGAFAGYYWCVPASFDMAMPIGEWDIHIWHGAEYVPVRDSLSVEPGKKTEKVYRMARWTDMPALGWYSGDGHVHSRMVSDKDASNVMSWAKAADIHIANVLAMGCYMRTYYEQRGFGKQFRVQDGQYALVPGQEDPRDFMGHASGLNLKSLARDESKYLFNDWVADEIHKQGGLCGPVHVAHYSMFETQREMTLMIAQGKVDYAEILQCGKLGTEYYYKFLDLGYKLTASAGSDTPYGSSIGEVRVYTYLGKQKFSADAWFDAFKNGHTFVTNGPMLEFSVEKAIPGDEIVVDKDQPLHVRARAWGLAGASAPTKLHVVSFSEVVKEAVPKSPDANSLELDFTINSGDGFWIAAYAEGGDGSFAQTTPVYVTRKGLRFWNVKSAEQLLDERIKTLAEIEQIVLDTGKKFETGQMWAFDLWNKQKVDLGPGLLDRINASRKIYEDLKETLKKEMPLRQKDRLRH